MALKACKDCGDEISKKAAFCPNCGRPYKKSNVGCLFSILIFMIVFMIIAGSA